MIIAAADGSSLSNPGPAGWAWFVDGESWHAGGWPHGTNNMGELMAVLDLLRSTAHRDEPLTILCDSQYVINSLTKWLPGWKRKGWKKADGKPVQNVDLLQAIDAAHLFGSNTTRIGLRRGTYIRQYEYDFIELFASQLSKKAVDMAMAGPGADDAYQL